MNIDRNALLLYLRDLRDLEIAKKRINTLYCNEKNLVDNQLANMQTLDLKAKDNKVEYSSYLMGMGIGLAMGFWFWNMSKNWATDFFSQMLSLLFKIMAGVGFLMFAVTLLIVICDILDTSNANKKASEHNAREIARVNSNADRAIKLEQEWNVRSVYLKNELAKVDSLLTAYYNQNILPKQYRTLPSLIYIYDYMSSSQENLKDTLIHEHMENGIQRILNKLDYIIAQNQSIIFNQHRSEAQNSKMIAQNQNMLKTLEQVERNTAEAAQYTKMSANYSQTSAYFAAATYLERK